MNNFIKNKNIGSLKEFLKRWHGEDRKNETLRRFGIAVWGKKTYDYKKPIKIK